MTFILLALFFVAAYFLLLRPQKQRLRQQRELMTAIGVGDSVVTAGGLIGTVVDENGDRLHVEISDGVVVEFLRMFITRRLDPTEDDDEEALADEEDVEDGAEDDEATEAGEAATDDGESAGDGESVPDGTVEPTLGATSPDGSIQEAAAPAPGQDPH